MGYISVGFKQLVNNYSVTSGIASPDNIRIAMTRPFLA